ncbi:hypothetical protein ACHAWF_006899 [Thalassiosira exigua]
MKFASPIVAAFLGALASYGGVEVASFSPSSSAVGTRRALFPPSGASSVAPAAHPGTCAPSSASSSSSSSTALRQYAAAGAVGGGTIDLFDEYAPRDVYGMEAWALQYGAQKAPGVELYSADGSDYAYVAQQGLGGGQTALYVPPDVVLNSAMIEQEFGTSLQGAEQVVVNIDEGTRARLPLFRLMVKILSEYEKGENSPFHPWLASLPRQYYNGVSMTDACFACLPPYAGWLASSERQNYSNFVAAIRQGGYLPLSPEVINDGRVLKWAYNVALTRFHEVWQPERAKLIAPLADMLRTDELCRRPVFPLALASHDRSRPERTPARTAALSRSDDAIAPLFQLNHGSEANCEITVDNAGGVTVTAGYDVPAGTPLTISLGDPTNPTPIFAQYGFLPNDCATIFCKAMHLDPQIQELGYDFKDLLFQTESGEIAPKVWDIFLYKILQDNDPGAADQFYVACKTNDEGGKRQYHDQYFQYTSDAMKQHVYGILQDVEQLTMKAQTYDLQTHPRVPVIVAHNTLVSQTFTMTAALLEQMG